MFKVLPYSDFVRSQNSEANNQRNQARTGMREDLTELTNNFKEDRTVAGSTLPSDFDSWTMLADNVVEVVVTRESDSVSDACTISSVDRVDGCKYGPADDVKFQYLCEMGGGSFSYGNESYDCSTGSRPSQLFCDAPSTVFLQL